MVTGHWGMATRVSLTASWLIFLFGCGEHPGLSEGVTISDSLGVELVYSARPQWASSEVWALSEGPELSIGVVAGSEPYEFYNIRHAGLLPDGTVWVAHSSRPPGFRIYDAGGNFIRSIGAGGEGPGEFRALSQGWVEDDGTLIGYDEVLERITRFTLDGRLIESRPIEIPDPLTRKDLAFRPRWFDRFGDGTLLGEPGNKLPDEAGRARAEFAFTRLDLQTFTFDTVALALGPEWVVEAGADGALPTVWYVEFTSTSIAVASDSTAFVSDNSDLWIKEVGPGGRVVRRFGRPSKAGPVTSEDLEEYRAELLTRAEDENHRRSLEGHFRTQAFAENWPAHGTRMLVDRVGNLWVALRSSEGSDVTTWSVFNPRGVWQGDVSTPAQLRVSEIHSDAVVGVWRDDLDVQSVRIYRLMKPDDGGR